MATGIEWTDETWNPVTGCDKVSKGCDHCYAEPQALKLQRWGVAKYRDGFAVRTHERVLPLPLHWRQPRKVFVNSMSDQFHDAVPDDFTDRVFAVMALTPRHTYQILTKRPQRAANYLNNPATPGRIAGHLAAFGGVPAALAAWPLPNVWIGTSVEQGTAATMPRRDDVRHRIRALTSAPAAVHFLSCEPLIGPLDLAGYLDDIEWVIAGGESGHDHRPVHADWLRAIRDQCHLASLPFFFKQWGGVTPKAGGKALDGREWCEFPAPAA